MTAAIAMRISPSPASLRARARRSALVALAQVALEPEEQLVLRSRLRVGLEELGGRPRGDGVALGGDERVPVELAGESGPLVVPLTVLVLLVL